MSRELLGECRPVHHSRFMDRQLVTVDSLTGGTTRRLVPERVQFKLGLIVRRCLRRRAPRYLVDYCTSVADVVSRQHLRSASRRQLVVPRHRLNTFGGRAFAVAGPMSWNSLPNSLRESACDDNISDDCFKHSLKTFLFSGY